MSETLDTFEQKTLDEVEQMQKSKRDVTLADSEHIPALPATVAGLPRDILMAYMDYCRLPRAKLRSDPTHECDSSCYPLISYHDTIFICRRSGNMHLCTTEYCEYKREEFDHEKVFCPLTFNQFALNTSVRFFEYDGDPTESNLEMDPSAFSAAQYDMDGTADGKTEEGEESAVEFDTAQVSSPVAFFLRCPSAVDEPVASKTATEAAAEAMASVPSRTWGVPIPRPEKIVHKRSRSALEASNDQDFVIRRPKRPRGQATAAESSEDKQNPETAAAATATTTHSNAGISSSHGNGNGNTGKIDYTFVRVRSQTCRSMTNESLRAAGASLIHALFTYLKVPVSENFVSWLMRITLVLLAEIEKHPLPKRRHVTYYFEEHVIVVMLELKQGLQVRGLPIVPRCPFVARTFPDTRDITLMGSTPSWRGRTRKHLLAVITQQLRQDERQLLSQSIAKLGVFE